MVRMFLHDTNKWCLDKFKNMMPKHRSLIYPKFIPFLIMIGASVLQSILFFVAVSV